MRTKAQTAMRIGAVGLAMMFGSLAISPATAAQDAEDPVAEEDDGGFDDWGLLGLLGLAGLAGLMRREPETRPMNRTDDSVR